MTSYKGKSLWYQRMYPQTAHSQNIPNLQGKSLPPVKLEVKFCSDIMFDSRLLPIWRQWWFVSFPSVEMLLTRQGCTGAWCCPCHSQFRARDQCLLPQCSPFPHFLVKHQKPAVSLAPSPNTSLCLTLALRHNWCPRQAQSYLFTLLSAPVTTYFSEVYCLVFSTHQYPFLLLWVCARCISIKSICQAKNLYCYICISLA